MSKVVDSRVVEMRFDNKQFEQGTKQTLGTLAKLKEALKFEDSSKALKNIDKPIKDIKLDGILSAVDNLNKKFSTLGVVGMTAVSNVTNALMGRLNQAVQSVTNSIVSGGIKRAMNIENAHFQLQALLKDEEKVQAIMADAMEAVDGTAYAYDEAAKAASQFAASGLKAGDEMLGALKGITGVAAMTNSSFESISTIFTTVAGNGRLMGDQLLQLSSRGLNVASTLADYFKQVRKESKITEADIRKMVTEGELDFRTFAEAMTWAFGDSAKRANETFTGAMSNMKSALARIGAGFVSPLVEQNGVLVELFNALRIKINEVKSDLVFDEQRSAIEGLGEATSMSDKKLERMFKRIKKEGYVTTKQMAVLKKKGADSYGSLQKYINGVADGSIRASYSTKTAIDDITKGNEVSRKRIRKLVKAGKIDLATFTSAMEESFGKEKTLSKQFTDFFQDFVSKLTKTVEKMDVSEPIDIFYKGLDASRNVLRGFLSVLIPVKDAFTDVYQLDPNFFTNLADSVLNLTSKMKLSEQGSRNLRDAFTGLFDFSKLIIHIFQELINAIIPINKPILDTGSNILELSGFLGKSLSEFSKAAQKSELLGKSIDFVGDTVKTGIKWISSFVKWLNSMIKAVVKFKPVNKTVNLLTKAFTGLGKIASPYVEKFKDGLVDLTEAMEDFGDSTLGNLVDGISKSFQNLFDQIRNFSLEGFMEQLKSFGSSIKSFNYGISENKGVQSFVQNISDYGKALKEAVSLENLLGKIHSIMDIMGDFVGWIRKVFGPALSEFNLGSAATIGGFAGIIYGLVKAANSLKVFSDSFQKLPKLLTGVQKSLEAYQSKLKAETLKNLAEAIGILCGSLLLLSFADPEGLMAAATAIGIAGGALITAFAKLKTATQKGNEATDALMTFSEGAKNLMTKFGKSLEIKALGVAIRNFAVGIGIIAASVIALGLMYERDKTALEAGAKGAGMIIAVAIGVLALIGKMSQNIGGENATGAKALAIGLVGFAASLYLMVSSINKLFKMEIPEDWKKKLGILAGIIGGLAIVLLAVAGAGAIAGKGSVSIGSLIGTAILLYTAVLSLEKLFKMELPSDTGTKVAIFLALFAGISLMLLALGKMSNLAGEGGGKGKDIASVGNLLLKTVAGLMLLVKMDAKQLLKGAATLSLVIGAVGLALYAAGKIQTEDSAKSISAMSGVITTITASLSVLALIPWEQLLKAAAALDSVLLSMAATLVGASKIAGKDAATGIMTVLLAIAGITASLYFLSNQPWDGMLAGGVALGLVLVAMAGAMKIMQNIKVDVGMVGTVALGLVAVAGIATALYFLAEQPWEGLLAAGTALSATMLALSASFAIVATVGTLAAGATAGLVGFDLFIANLLAVLLALGALCQNETVVKLLDTGSEIFVKLGSVIGDFIGNIIEGVMGGINAGIADLGTNLSAFMMNAQPFFIGLRMIDETMVKNAGYLVAVIGALTVESLINGIARFVGANITGLGKELAVFGVLVRPFISSLSLFDDTSVKAADALAKLLIAMTGAELVSGISRFLSFLGGDPLTEFANGMSTFGGGIKGFVDSVSDISEADVEKANIAATIGQKIASMSKTISSSGGIVQKIFGEKDLAKFAEGMSGFGEAVKTFAKNVDGIPANAADNAAAVGDVMAQLDSKLTPHGGVIAMFTGDQSLAGFGSQLIWFGRKLKSFINETKDIKKKDVEEVAGATESLTKIADDVPYMKSAFAATFSSEGDNSIARFGEQLADFAESLKTFLEQIDGIDYSPIDAFRTGMNKIISTAKAAEGLTLDNLANLTTFGNQTNYDGLRQFVDGISAFEADVKAQSKKIVDAITNTLKAGYAQYKLIGTASMNWFMQGFKPNVTDVRTSIRTIISTIDGLSSDFQNAGSNMASGFIRGIQNENRSAYLAGYNLGKNASRGTKEALKEKSPSKVMEGIGNYAGLGFINGFRIFLQEGYQNGRLLGEKTTEGVKYGLNDMSQVINGDFYSPVITPKADLSELRKSADQITQMFNSAIQTTSISARDVQIKMAGRKDSTTVMTDELRGIRSGFSGIKAGDTYNINGIDYSESSDVGEALETIVHVAKMKRRV